ncbi:DNA-processing protein DprA [Metabacillus malikii]|uniref:DNA processing protein n=1 Tax=Metabacillus malikii TaxID=1504265 RepID=A0ABT9ZE48_9BACI|nr:DNA-processing protein DprA [Metabacillus malikii]MDQ0230547.1 DNA processing protein [Metabacillus malikii]
MNLVTKKLFLLSHCKSLNQRLLLEIIKKDPTLQFIDSEHIWPNIGLSNKQLHLIRNEYLTLSFNSLYNYYKQEKISFLPIFDANYPPLLKEIPDPPPFLYYKGNINILNTKLMISVVGTRYPTAYGRRALEFILKPLVYERWVIVSGMAKGIDTLAHKASINDGGKTVAVIAGGLNNVYPKENIELASELAANHLILSEHTPSTEPQKWHFPMRNRIISGLSLGTIIIQAKKRSGSLITANQALEQNREVFAIPGSIFDECSAGTNELIKSGAKLVQHPLDIIEEFVSL